MWRSGHVKKNAARGRRQYQCAKDSHKTMVHRFEIFCKAMKISFVVTSVIGKESWFLESFRIEKFSDSIALIV